MQKRVSLVISTICMVIAVSLPARDRAKYVFLFVGDGMGPLQVEATEKAFGRKLTMTSLAVHGTCTTHSANSKVTDSAASGTALACGVKTNNRMIGLSPNGETVENLSETARKRGMKIGIITSVTINHATPASFYAHAKTRYEYFAIARQLAGSDYQYFAGGGMNKQKNSGEDALELAQQNGFQIARKRQDLLKLKPGGKVYAFNHRLQGGALPWAMEYRKDDIALAEFVETGIRLLQNDKGFFMMVEGGKIDWAGHANHLPNIVHDTAAFDQAVAVAVQFLKKHPNETLIVVTADHETGGLEKLKDDPADPAVILKYTAAVDQALRDRSEKLLAAKADADAAATAIAELCGITLTKTERETAGAAWTNVLKRREQKKKYGAATALGAAARKILTRRAGYNFTTGGHSATAVPVYAVGVGAKQFKGAQDNVDIPTKIRALLPQGPAQK